MRVRIANICLLLWCFILKPVASQICNYNDPRSGGLAVPAFSTGGAWPTYKNGSKYSNAFCPFDDNDLPLDPDCVPPETDPQATAIAYVFLLLWTFMGVGLFADVFMSAIEVITSKKKIVSRVGKNGEETTVEVDVWNATVANLTLMALGSSAPEILLSVIEITSAQFISGQLGPSTIVGSAAFNLMVIIAVCVSAVPSKENDPMQKGFRKIETMSVFGITAFSSIFAYIWLLIILKVHTPNEVGIEEAVVTLIFFPLLAILSYLADSGKCTKKKNGGDVTKILTDISGLCVEEPIEGDHAMSVRNSLNKTKTEAKLNELDELLKDFSFTSTGDPNKDAQLLAKVVIYKKSQNKKRSRAAYRVNAGRLMTGGAPVIPTMPDVPTEEQPSSDEVTIGFASTKYAVLESENKVKLYVECKFIGKEELVDEYTINWRTGSTTDTATANSDYDYSDGTLTFTRKNLMQTIEIKIHQDEDDEDDEVFSVVLSNPSTGAKLIKEKSEAKITIIDDENPGEIQFEQTTQGTKNVPVRYIVKQNIGNAVVKVVRKKGSSGEVSVNYTTEDGFGSHSAIEGQDYTKSSGSLTFKTGEVEKYIQVPIIDNQGFEKDEKFHVKLSKPMGCELGNLTIGEIIIQTDKDAKALGDKVVKLLGPNVDKMNLGSSNWGDQFKEVFAPPEPGSNLVAKVMFMLNIPWKLMGAFIPPTIFLGGWLCFVISLCFIGGMTAIIGDIAALFGCCVGLKDSVTAITFVALGTSLPDTFASKSAAVGDPTADNSIGNVTGSNSVNVFLGLGLPWTMAAVYWNIQGPTNFWKQKVGPKFANEYPDGAFIVDAGDLGFSVIVFCACAVTTIFTLIIRRLKFGGELGGKATKPTSMFFVLLWFVYVTLSILKSYRIL